MNRIERRRKGADWNSSDLGSCSLDEDELEARITESKMPEHLQLPSTLQREAVHDLCHDRAAGGVV